MSAPLPVSRRRFLQLTAVHAVTLAAGRLGAGTPAGGAPIRWAGITLGAETSIQVYGDEVAATRRTLRECRREISRLERIFSLYDDTSALAQLNRFGRLNHAPRELLELLAFSRRVSEATAGAFDITIQPLCEALAASRGVENDQVRAARALVDYRRIECDGCDVHLAVPGMRLTLNGIAQGYITDRIAELLRARGYEHMLVDIGEKRAWGEHADGRPWRIGLESPLDRSRLIEVVALQQRALATSGGYGRIYDRGGGRHHLLDARTGSSRHDFASVSVLAPTAVEADALSTSLAVCVPELGPRLLREFPDAEALVVDPGGALHRIRPSAG